MKQGLNPSNKPSSLSPQARKTKQPKLSISSTQLYYSSMTPMLERSLALSLPQLKDILSPNKSK